MVALVRADDGDIVLQALSSRANREGAGDDKGAYAWNWNPCSLKRQHRLTSYYIGSRFSFSSYLCMLQLPGSWIVLDVLDFSSNELDWIGLGVILIGLSAGLR